MQMRKDCNGGDSRSPRVERELRELEEARSGRRNSFALFSLGNFFWTQDDDAVEGEELLPMSMSVHCFALPDVCRYCGEKAPRHFAECVESYFANKYANIVSVWRTRQAFIFACLKHTRMCVYISIHIYPVIFSLAMNAAALIFSLLHIAGTFICLLFFFFLLLFSCFHFFFFSFPSARR